MIGPVPARVDGTVKLALLDLIDHAVAGGWTFARACTVLEVDRQRVWRWQHRRRHGETLDDGEPGGTPIHGLLDWETDAIVKLYDEWAGIDFSHRKLAHRGSYLGIVWVSPSTVDRVLAKQGLRLGGLTRPQRTHKTPWPAWSEWRPNQLWCWDGSQFEACEDAKYAYAIIDLVSRKWIGTHLTANPDSVAVNVLFVNALQAEGLLSAEIQARLADPANAVLDNDDDDVVPILVAVSDNGTEMRSKQTRRLMALMSIAQHFGRPSTPTDQAWIETLWGHVKYEHPHLTAITDPTVLRAELERVREHYNSVRLHESIGYVTPNDEHEGRGDMLRAARRAGMNAADQARRRYHTQRRNNPT